MTRKITVWLLSKVFSTEVLTLALSRRPDVCHVALATSTDLEIMERDLTPSQDMRQRVEWVDDALIH